MVGGGQPSILVILAPALSAGRWVTGQGQLTSFFFLLTLQIVDLCGLSGNVLIKRLQGDICLFHFSPVIDY